MEVNDAPSSGMAVEEPTPTVYRAISNEEA